MLCHTLKNVKGKTVSDASARNKVKSSKYGEDSILQKSDLLFFFSIFPAVFIGVSCWFECSPRKCFIIIIAKKIVWKWTLRKEYSLISFKRLKWMRNMKATMQNTLWSKIKRRVYPNHAKKSLRIILLWDFRNCILWYYIFEMCPKKVDWNVKPFFATGLAETQVGHAIANIGSLVGGLLSPHHERKSKDKQRGKFGSDDAADDDNIISLTVSYRLSSF